MASKKVNGLAAWRAVWSRMAWVSASGMALEVVAEMVLHGGHVPADLGPTQSVVADPVLPGRAVGRPAGPGESVGPAHVGMAQHPPAALAHLLVEVALLTSEAAKGAG